MPDLGAFTIPADRLDAVVAALDINDTKVGLDPATALEYRALKTVEELGEAVAALIGMAGQNPRKGSTHTEADLLGELYDIALTAIVGSHSLLPAPAGIHLVASRFGDSRITIGLARIVEAVGLVGGGIVYGADAATQAGQLGGLALIALSVAASLTADWAAGFAGHVEAKTARLVEAVDR